MTINEIINLTFEYLETKGYSQSRYYADKLISSALGLNRIELYLQSDRPLNPKEIEDCREKLKYYITQEEKKNQLRDCIDHQIQLLETNNIFEAKRSVEEIVAHVLNISRLEILFQADRILNEEETQLIETLVTRRLKREPLQYILNRSYFYGFELYVNKDVLIPRPETEELVDKIVKIMHPKQKIKILDIGTGSGCIAIALKKTWKDADIIAWDISEKALIVAEKNALKYHTDIHFQKADILNETVTIPEIDIIVSNPPYISLIEYQDLQDEVRLFEPSIALHDNAEGLLFYETIITKIKKMTVLPRYAFFEIGADQATKLRSMASEIFPTSLITVDKDLFGKDRFLIIEFS